MNRPADAVKAVNMGKKSLPHQTVHLPSVGVLQPSSFPFYTEQGIYNEEGRVAIFISFWNSKHSPSLTNLLHPGYRLGYQNPPPICYSVTSEFMCD